MVNSIWFEVFLEIEIMFLWWRAVAQFFMHFRYSWFVGRAFFRSWVLKCFVLQLLRKRLRTKTTSNAVLLELRDIPHMSRESY